MEVATEAGVSRFVWIASACVPGTELGDRIWLIPPISASATPVYTVEFETRLLKPNYCYQRHPGKQSLAL